MPSSEKKKDILTIKEILSVTNIATLLDDNTLTNISKQVFDDFSKDQTSCEDKISQLQDKIQLAKMVAKEKSYPWEGASNVIYPLIANAAIEFGATLYPEIIKDSTVVKAKVIGKDDGEVVMTAKGPAVNPETGEPIITDIGAKKKRGDRVSTFMNYQLLDEMAHWETDVDKMGNSQPVIGNMYKRVYWDTNENRAESDLIYPDKLIVNNSAKNLDNIATHIIELYPQDIMNRIRSGMYVNFDWDYEQEKENQSDPTDINSSDSLEEGKNYGFNTKLHTFLDQFTWLDLDDDGFPEPYLVTAHSNTCKVVSIIARFKEDDIKYNSKKEVSQIKLNKKVAGALVKYGFIPSPDGSFYDISFGDLLYSINLSVNSTLNQLFDAGHLNITGGGFLGKGFSKVKGGRIALSPGEWRMVDIMGEDLARNIVPIPQPRPDPTLFALLGYLVEAGKNMALLRDVLSGESAGNIQATTYVSMVEQGLKQFKSIYKRFYKSLKEELKLIYDLNAEYLDNEKYSEVLDENSVDVDVKQDFNDKDYNICPVADIDAVTSYQRMAQAQFLMSFMGNPNIDQMDLLKRIMEIAQIDNVEKLVVAPPPQINPLLEVEQLKAQVKMQEIEVKMQALQLEAQNQQQQSAINTQVAIAELEELRARVEKLHTASMVDLANVSKIGKDIEDSQQEREVKIMDNLIDQQTKQLEVAGRIKEAEMKQMGEAMKIQHTAIKMDHEKKKMDKELATPSPDTNKPKTNE